MATSSQCEIRGLSEIFFDSIIETDDKRLNISLEQTNQETKKGRGMYVSIIRRDNLCTFTRILSGWNKIGGRGSIFLLVFIDLHFKTKTGILIEVFNARSFKWWAFDKDSPEGRKIESLTSTAGYSQLIDQQKHITNTSSSCIDLVSTTNSSFLKDSGIELSLFDICHHNIIFGKARPKISLLSPYTWKCGTMEKQM